MTEEEYTKFYHSLAKVGTMNDVHPGLLVQQFYTSANNLNSIQQDFGDEKPLSWSHFNAEGDVEFKAVLFVPPKAPQDLYESYYNANKSNLKLYVRRVFISDEFDELLPKYLNFLLVIIFSSNSNNNATIEL